MISKASAVVACLALAVLTTYAQGPQAGRGGQRQAATAAPASSDPKKVIETMMDNLGMLRGMQRNDSVNRIEMWGENGTKVVGGKPRIEIERAAGRVRNDEIEGLAAIELLGRLRVPRQGGHDRGHHEECGDIFDHSLLNPAAL